MVTGSAGQQPPHSDTAPTAGSAEQQQSSQYLTAQEALPPSLSFEARALLRRPDSQQQADEQLQLPDTQQQHLPQPDQDVSSRQLAPRRSISQLLQHGRQARASELLAASSSGIAADSQARARAEADVSALLGLLTPQQVTEPTQQLLSAPNGTQLDGEHPGQIAAPNTAAADDALQPQNAAPSQPLPPGTGGSQGQDEPVQSPADGPQQGTQQVPATETPAQPGVEKSGKGRKTKAAKLPPAKKAAKPAAPNKAPAKQPTKQGTQPAEPVGQRKKRARQAPDRLQPPPKRTKVSVQQFHAQALAKQDTAQELMGKMPLIASKAEGRGLFKKLSKMQSRLLDMMEASELPAK